MASRAPYRYTPVRDALNMYQSHTLVPIGGALEDYIERLDNAQFSAADRNTPFISELADDPQALEQALDDARLGSLQELLDDDLVGITKPSDLLRPVDFHEWSTKLCLGGVRVGENEEQRAEKNKEYFDLLEQALRLKCLPVPQVQTTISIPREFRELATYVDAILGSPGT